MAWARLHYDDSALSAAQRGCIRRCYGPSGLRWPWCVRRWGLCGGWWPGSDGSIGRWGCQEERALLTVASALLLGAALAWVGWQAGVAGRASIQPDQIAKAQAMVRSSAALIARALEAGVPADGLVGVEAHAAALHAQSPEIAELAFLAPDGRLLAEPFRQKAGSRSGLRC